jgi:hypothetical protein
MDRLPLLLKNAVCPGTRMICGPKLAHGRYVETVEVKYPARGAPLAPNQGRGVASGYWFNGVKRIGRRLLSGKSHLAWPFVSA